MKALILGGGFAGTTVAHLLHRSGWECTIIEKDQVLGGGCRTYFYGGHPFTYGPRLYYGYSDKVFAWVNGIVPIRRFPFELKTLAHEPVDAERRFWTYPPHELDFEHYPRAAAVKAELTARDNSKEPADFDEYYRQKVGPTLYDMFTDHYSKKMWSIESNKVFDIFKWSAKDRPIESGTREAYKGSYIGYPVSPDGYNGYFDRMVEGVSILYGAEIERVRLDQRSVRLADGRTLTGDVVVSTIPIDELCGHALGELPYAGREFSVFILPCRQVFPGDVRFCHYAGTEPWTRITEFKKLTYHESEDTLLVAEKPSKANKLYPYLTKANMAKVEQYLATLPEGVMSIGRLGLYKYSTIEQTIVQAFEAVAKITGEPNEMAGQFFAIGDTALMKDRKEAA